MARTTGAMLGTLLLTCPHVFPASTPNLLRNGDFELGVQGWTPNEVTRAAGTFAMEADAKRGGEVCALENRDGEGTAMVSQTIPADTSKLYTLSGYSRSTALQEGAGIAIHALGADGLVLERRWVHQIPSWGIKAWREFHGDYSPPENTSHLRIAPAVYKKGKAWFDALAVTARDRPKATNPWATRVEDFGIEVQRIDTPRPVYHMAVHDLDGDGQVEIIGGDIDGTLRVQKQDGAVLWDFDLGGLALDIACGDVDGDGQPDIAVCSADINRRIRVFDRTGKHVWAHSEPGRVFGHVSVAEDVGTGGPRLFATQANRVAAFDAAGKRLWEQTFGGPRMRELALGDTDGDGHADVAVTLNAQRLFAAAFGTGGQPTWRYEPVGGPATPGEDICVADIDGDGSQEVLFGSGQGTVVCLANGAKRWMARRERPKLWPKHRDATAHLGTTPVEIAVLDVLPERPGLETLVALVDSVWLLDSAGKFVWETQSGLLLLDLHPGPEGEIYAPSSGLRDPSVYRLRCVRGRGNALAEVQPPNRIYDGLADTYEQAVAMEPAVPAASAKAHVIFADLLWPFARYGSLERLKTVHEALREKENEHLEFVFMLWPKDLPVELRRGQMSEQKEILEVVRFLEELGRPFLFFVDHGCAPNLSLDSIRKTLELAPATCRGFYVAENTARYPSAKWDEFVVWATKVMDLCLEHGGKKLIFKEMYDAWCALPPDPAVRGTLLQLKYRDVIVAMYATNNPHAPELQIGGMIGLKQSGLISDWGISTQYWNWSWAAHGLCEHFPNICPADVTMRMELSSACLGARWFHIEGGQEYLLRSTGGLDPRATLHRDLVYELIRKGLLPVADAANLSFSPALIARGHHPATDEAREQGKTLGSPRSRPFTPLRTGFLGVDQAVLTVHPGYLPGYAYGVRRYCDTMVPTTPYGYLRFVPECPETRPFLRGKTVISTDGDQVRLGARELPAEAARPLVSAELAAAAKELPFTASGTSLYTHRVGDGYRVWLLDPGYMAPEGVRARLTIRLSGEGFSATDALTGTALDAADGKIPVDVPPGGFRAVDVRAR